MGTDSRNEMDRSMLSAEARQKFDELVTLMAAEKYGPSGPPIDTTFADIEQFGHQTGQLLGRALNEHVTHQHADHFQEASCPTCGATGRVDAVEPTKTRLLQTDDGKIPLAEPVIHCPRCARAFFPSAERTSD